MAYWISEANNQWSTLHDVDPAVEQELFNSMKVRAKSYFFDPRFRAGIWDGYEVFYDKVNHRCLTGLVPWATEMGFEFEERIEATDPLGESDWPTTVQIRSPRKPEEWLTPTGYQTEAYDSVALLHRRRGIFAHCTGAGKSPLAGMIIKGYLEARGLDDLRPRVVLTVPRINLLEDFRDDLTTMLGEPIGQLGGGKQDFKARVVVAFDGFIKQYIRSPFVKALAVECELLISDELQTATKKLYPFYRQCVGAYYRYGLSGSFFDMAPERIFQTAGFFGSVITSVSDADTMEAGRTVPPRFVFYEFFLRRTPDATYGEAYSDVIVNNPAYNKFFAEEIRKRYDEGKTILVMTQRVAHCRIFQEALSFIGVESEQYHGKINTMERKTLRASFKNGKLPVLIATEQTFGIGVDIPRIECFLNLGGGLSDDKNRQKYGRSLRSFTEKDSVEIIEPYFTGHKWFAKHSKARMALAKSFCTGNTILVPMVEQAF